MEHMALHLHTLLATACREGSLGEGGRAATGLKIILRESPTAWAAYDAELT